MLEFQHANRNTIEIQHQIRPSLVVAFKRHLFGDGEIILLRGLPIDQMHRCRGLPRLKLHRHTIAQQGIHGLVITVETAAMVLRRAVQLVQRGADLRGAVATLCQMRAQQTVLDITVPLAVAPIAQVGIPQLSVEQRNDPVLGNALGLGDGGHTASTFVLCGRQIKDSA